jgi:hypothetical protein
VHAPTACRVFIDHLEASGFGKPANRLQHYARFLPHVYAHAFPHQLRPRLLFVTRIGARVKRIKSLAERLLPPTVRWKVALTDDAVAWLAPLSDAPQPSASEVAHA